MRADILLTAKYLHTVLNKLARTFCQANITSITRQQWRGNARPLVHLTSLLVVATNRTASAHLWQNLPLDHQCCLARLGSFIKSSIQAHETEIPMVVVCCCVVSPQCANYFYIYWIDPLFNCSGLHFCFRSDGS